MAIPTITNANDLIAFKQWQQSLIGATKTPAVPRVPWNFVVTSKQGGNYLTWEPVESADGYIVDISLSGDFSTSASNTGNISTVTLPGQNNVTYFDNVPTSGGAAPSVRYYRVRATAGTVQQPQSLSGRPSSVISSTGIAPSDTTTTSTTARDTSTTDSNSVGGRKGYQLPE